MAGFAVASTLAEALERLEEPGARPIAGGVGIMLARARGLDPGGDVVGVGRLPELGGSARRADGTWEIGAARTLEAIAMADDDVLPPLLRAAALAAANPGIRAVATLGGNVVQMGAASDLVAALIALGADALIVRRDGRRSIPVERLWTEEFTGPDLEPGELIRSFGAPSPAPVGWGWERLTLHGAMDRSAATVAVALLPDGAARVAVTAAVTRPIRLDAVERILAGATASTGAAGTARDVDDAELAATVRRAAREALDAAPVLDDDRAPAAYRREVVPVLAERAVRAALVRARASTDG